MRATLALRLAFVLSAPALVGCATTGMPEPEPPYLAVRGLRLMGSAGAASRAVVHAYVIWRKPDEDARVSEYMGSINHGDVLPTVIGFLAGMQLDAFLSVIVHKLVGTDVENVPLIAWVLAGTVALAAPLVGSTIGAEW